MINGLSGALGDGAFNGWASVDIASKPLVKLDLDFQHLDVAVTPENAASSDQQGLQHAWSNASIDLTGLNYVDAQVRISAAELSIGQARLAPAAIDAALAGGVLKARFSNLGAYGGQANGDLIVDASAASPTYTLRTDLVGVRALPLLKSAADFDKLDGKLQAKIALRSTGPSQRAIMSNLSGTVFAVFQDGAIKGLNVAQMIRSLTASPLSGWQEGKEQATDLTQLSASFRIERGQATTTDLNLVGPLVRVTGAGTIDLGTQALAFRVEPKLVMTTEGQGRAVRSGRARHPRDDRRPLGSAADLSRHGRHPGQSRCGLCQAEGDGQGPVRRQWRRPRRARRADQRRREYRPERRRQRRPIRSAASSARPWAICLQQGLGQGLGQGRNIPAQPAPTPAAPATPAAPPPSDSIPPASQDSQPMNDVLRQLFNRWSEGTS